MNVELVLLAPLLVLLTFLAFGFTGCSSFAAVDDWPPQSGTPEPGAKYEDLVKDTDGFHALWPLNEGPGEDDADVIGPEPAGKYVGGAAPGSPGAFAHKETNTNFAPALDGTSGYVEVAFSETLNLQNGNAFSIELWAKPAGAIGSGTEQVVISSHHTSAAGNHRGYEIAVIGNGGSPATVRGRVFWTTAPFVTNVDITPGGDPVAWRHIVLSHSGSGQSGTTLRLAVSVAGVAGTVYNEQLNAEYREVQPGGNGARPLRFGAGHLQAGGPEKFFAGSIDEVAFYKGVLGKTDVETHFQAF